MQRMEQLGRSHERSQGEQQSGGALVMAETLLEGGVAFVIAFVLGTLVEYVVHRLMHNRYLLGKKHAEHHRDGWGQGWLGEFGDYFLPTVLVIWVGLLYSIGAGIGWAL